MRFSKTPGLVALAAVVSMAFVGAGTASAGPTTLCRVHEEPCAAGNQLDLVHLELFSGTVLRLLGPPATILCLEVLSLLHVEGGLLQNPLPLDVLLDFKKCGSNAAHNNCTKTVLEQPLMLLLRTALNLGTLNGSRNRPGKINLHCTILGINVNCDYSWENISFPVEGALHQGSETGHGMITANETPAALTEPLGGAGFLCPENTTMDFLLEALPDHVYIMT